MSTASGDFFAEPLPQADVITMGLILHDWNLDRKRHLIRSAYDALPVGGALIVVENLIDDARRVNAFGLMMSLNMLIEFGDACAYTGADFAGGCTDAGFRKVEIVPLTGPASAGIAFKEPAEQPRSTPCPRSSPTTTSTTPTTGSHRRPAERSSPRLGSRTPGPSPTR